MKKHYRVISVICSFILVFLAAVGAPAASESGSLGGISVNAAVQGVTYINVDYVQERRTCEMVETNTQSNTVWGRPDAETWYAVDGDVLISRRITVLGKVNIILMDGCNLNAEDGITVLSGNELNIFGQSGESGVLNAKTTRFGYSAIGGYKNSIIGSWSRCGTITIYGGVINAAAKGWLGLFAHPADIGDELERPGGVVGYRGGVINGVVYDSIPESKFKLIVDRKEASAEVGQNVTLNAELVSIDDESKRFGKPLTYEWIDVSDGGRVVYTQTASDGGSFSFTKYKPGTSYCNVRVLFNGVPIAELASSSYFKARFIETTYSVTIPSTLNVNDGVSSTGNIALVKAENVNIMDNKTLKITVDSANDQRGLNPGFSISNGDDMLAYRLTAKKDSAELQDLRLGDTVLETASTVQQITELTATLSDGYSPKYAGVYSGTITFKVTIE